MLKPHTQVIGVMFGVRLPDMTEQETWLEQQKEKHEKEISFVSYAQARYDICKQCDQLIKNIMICKACYCFLPGKTRLKSSECPLEKWGSVDEA